MAGTRRQVKPSRVYNGRAHTMNLLLYWMISAVSLAAAVYVAGRLGFDAALDPENPWPMFLGVALLGLVNATVGVVAKLITAPLNCLTFGIAWLVINAALFLWVGQLKIGFFVGDFWAALFCSVVMGVILGFLRRFAVKGEKTA
ncbi:MAG: phage holin family protein [Armatimonadetes bacterium]|nr:phage holin family protein [Armatimonadota bacterium]